VKEGEQATAENARGVPSQLVAKYNKLLKGERLDDTQRKDFVTQAKAVYQAHLVAQDKFDDFTRQVAGNRGYNLKNVMDPNLRLKFEDEGQGGAGASGGMGDPTLPSANATPKDPLVEAAAKANGATYEEAEYILKMRASNAKSQRR
jgi:hypothetical protein